MAVKPASEWPRITVVPFVANCEVRWTDGKPRCSRHGDYLVRATAIGLPGDGHICGGCVRDEGNQQGRQDHAS